MRVRLRPCLGVVVAPARLFFVVVIFLQCEPMFSTYPASCVHGPIKTSHVIINQLKLWVAISDNTQYLTKKSGFRLS